MYGVGRLEQKRRMRASMRRALARIPSEQAGEAGRAIADRLAASSLWSDARAVVLFSTLAGEVDSTPLVDRARWDRKSILFPRMRVDSGLDFSIVEDLDELVLGRFGVREPAHHLPSIPLASDMIALVPGLAFDREGGRLGRGAGYYDRALVQSADKAGRPVCLGVGFALQIVECVPMDSLDVRLDGVLTENELVGPG
jgi:5-formyltetrahydrofolate cyclo-ligase